MTPANDNLPGWPRGLSRTQAARYVGVAYNIWDKMVAAGEMPQPKRSYGRTIWDKLAVDAAFDLLDGGHARTPGGEEIVDWVA